MRSCCGHGDKRRSSNIFRYCSRVSIGSFVGLIHVVVFTSRSGRKMWRCEISRGKENLNSWYRITLPQHLRIASWVNTFVLWWTSVGCVVQPCLFVLLHVVLLNWGDVLLSFSKRVDMWLHCWKVTARNKWQCKSKLCSVLLALLLGGCSVMTKGHLLQLN